MVEHHEQGKLHDVSAIIVSPIHLSNQCIKSWLKSHSKGQTCGKHNNGLPSNDLPVTNVSVATALIIPGLPSMNSATLDASVVHFTSAYPLEGFSPATGANNHPEVASIPIPAAQVILMPHSAMLTDE